MWAVLLLQAPLPKRRLGSLPPRGFAAMDFVRGCLLMMASILLQQALLQRRLGCLPFRDLTARVLVLA